MGQSRTNLKPRSWFARSVLQASVSSSTTALCRNPAWESPSARPPAPANNSMDVFISLPETKYFYQSEGAWITGIPRLQVLSSHFGAVFSNLINRVYGSAPVYPARNVYWIWAAFRIVDGDARNTHE